MLIGRPVFAATLILLGVLGLAQGGYPSWRQAPKKRSS
jgi:hypothetical protein